MATTELSTFSAAVDELALTSGRPDRKTSIISWLRVAIREIQTLGRFERDLVEDQLTANADPYVWTYPVELRQFAFASYPSLVDARGLSIFPAARKLGKRLQSETYYFYPADNYIVFAGHGATAQTTQPINVAYYRYLPVLQYYPPTGRPARYLQNDLTFTTDWDYLTATTDADKLAAQALVSNWVLFNWYEAAKEGALSKIFKAYNDPRAVSSFALYSSYKRMVTGGDELLQGDPT